MERTTPEAIDLQADLSRACSRPAMRRARWRSPRTRWPCIAPPGCGSRSPCSRTSPRTTSTSTPTWRTYFLAKRTLFVPRRRGWPAERGASPAAVVNVDDPYGARLAAEMRDCRRPAGRRSRPAGSGGRPAGGGRGVRPLGSRFRCLGPTGEVDVRIPLPGHFNVENALAAMAAADVLGVPIEARRGRAGGRRPGPGALRAGRRGAAVRGPGRLRPHAGLARERARGGAPADRGPADRGVRLRRRSRSREAAADGRDRGAAGGRVAW